MRSVMKLRAKSSHKTSQCNIYINSEYEISSIGNNVSAGDVKGQLLNLASRIGPNLVAIRRAVEESVRNAHYEYRELLNALIPVFAFKLSFDHIKHMDNNQIPRIDLTPDLYPYILQAYLPALSCEDRISTVLRSCFTFFLPSKRIQRRSEWEEEFSTSLTVFLRACLPSLLSLYPTKGTKDLDFDFRVAIYERWHSLLCGSHKGRCTFFQENRMLLIVCFSEYALYYISNVQPISKQILSLQKAAQLCRNYNNIGQLLRTEINNTVTKYKEENGKVNLDELLVKFCSRAQLMFDRGLRYSKSIGCKPNVCEKYDKDTDTLRKNRWRRDDVLSVFNENPRILYEIPYTDDFSIFQRFCERKGILNTKGMIIWYVIRHLQVKPMTAQLATEQTRALSAKYVPGSTEMRNMSCCNICLVCSFLGHEYPLRYNPESHRQMCSRCGIPDTVLNINLIGRIMYVHGVGFALSPCSAETEIFQPIEFMKESGLVDTMSKITFKEVARNMKLRNICQNLSFGSYIVASINILDRIPIPIMTINDGEENLTWTDYSQTHKNCMQCRSISIIETHTLIDTCRECLVNINLCQRHCIPSIAKNIQLITVADYWRIQEFIHSVYSRRGFAGKVKR